MLEELERSTRPTVLAAVRLAVEAASHDLDFTRLDPAAFAACPSISVDYALAERTDADRRRPGRHGNGPTSARGARLWELGEQGRRAGNVAVGDVLLEGAARIATPAATGS